MENKEEKIPITTVLFAFIILRIAGAGISLLTTTDTKEKKIEKFRSLYNNFIENTFRKIDNTGSGILSGAASLFRGLNDIVSDPVTGIAANRFMNVIIEKKLAEAKRYNTVFSFLIMAIPGITIHSKWRKIQKRISVILFKELRKADFIIKHDKREFYILLQNTDNNEARIVAERLQKNIESNLDVIVHIGLVTYNRDIQDREDLIRRAKTI